MELRNINEFLEFVSDHWVLVDGFEIRLTDFGGTICIDTDYDWFIVDHKTHFELITDAMTFTVSYDKVHNVYVEIFEEII